MSLSTSLFEGVFQTFLLLTKDCPLLMGFFKFALFASAGELIALRVALRKWHFPQSFFFRILLWGVVGVAVAFSFDFYSLGVKSLQLKGKLPGAESLLAFAFFTSFFNNLTFAPLMMSFHKLSHVFLERLLEGKDKRLSLEAAVDSVDWKAFFKKVCLKKIPFFWLPAHTLTFLLPDMYRVLFAAFLSLLLGIFLTA